MPGIAPSAEDTAVNKTDRQQQKKNPWPCEADVLMNEKDNKYITQGMSSGNVCCG